MLHLKSLLLLALLPLFAKSDDMAVCEFEGSITGALTISQYSSSDVLRITGELVGEDGVVTDGEHGFHIHEFGELGNNCSDAGGHYNPMGNDHGAPEDVNRHMGDLGNVDSSANVIIVDITDTVALIRGEYSILDKSIVLHEGTDDLGQGGEEDSLTTGHAGARLGCCLIKSVVVDSGNSGGDNGTTEDGAVNASSSSALVLIVASLVSALIRS